MSLTFTETKLTIDEIAQRSERNRRELKRGRDLIASSGGDLTDMEFTYGQFVEDLNAAAAANPGDLAWGGAKATMDKLVSDFVVLKARAVAMLTAVDGVE